MLARVRARGVCVFVRRRAMHAHVVGDGTGGVQLELALFRPSERSVYVCVVVLLPHERTRVCGWRWVCFAHRSPCLACGVGGVLKATCK